MSLNQYTTEQLKEMSLIEIAFEFLEGKKEAVSFKEIMDEITNLVGLTEDEVRAKIAQFYTDLNIDGRFLSLGENRWGLRVWYPVDQAEEDTVTAVKPKKKKAKKVVDEDEDLDIDEYEELDEEDLDFDDVDEFEEDDDSDDDDDLLDDDLEETELEEIIEDEEFDLEDEDEDDDLEDDDDLELDEEDDK